MRSYLDVGGALEGDKGRAEDGGRMTGLAFRARIWLARQFVTGAEFLFRIAQRLRPIITLSVGRPAVVS